MRNRTWRNYLFAFAIVVALGIVANAELRVLLLFVDALGLELVALLFLIQIRLLLTTITGASATLVESFFEAVKRRVLGANPPFVAYRPLALCPLLWLISYGNHRVRDAAKG